MSTAGYANGVTATHLGDRVRLTGPTRSHTQLWKGTQARALELLAGLEDRAGVAAFWTAFLGDDQAD
jgi:hypothetical protein